MAETKYFFAVSIIVLWVSIYIRCLQKYLSALMTLYKYALYRVHTVPLSPVLLHWSKPSLSRPVSL